MNRSSAGRLSVALIHHPVINKNAEVIASAVTNLDLHDISRACATFGVADFFVVTPLEDQQDLIRRIVRYWTEGAGGRCNPRRRRALEVVRLAPSLEGVLEALRNRGDAPVTVATCARAGIGSCDCGTLRGELESGKSFLLLFGTAWGLAESVLRESDRVLLPIRGDTDYNHLSVRSAVSIVLDRILGRTDGP